MTSILRAVDSRLGGNLLFMFLMAVGAGLSLVRGFGAAVILPVAEFGLYALLVAVAAFVSSIAGFGKIEETRKLFPRMAVDGHGGEIAAVADRLAWLVGKRLMLISVPLCIASMLFLSPTWTVAIIAGILLVFGVAWLSILASALRSGSSLNQTGVSAATRAIITLIFTFLGAYKFGFAGAVCGEAFGSLIACILMRYFLEKMEFFNSIKEKYNKDIENKISPEGIFIFLGAIATSIPIYLGRSIVGIGYSDEIVGTYSFIFLLISSVITMLGITEQFTGPNFIKSQRKNDFRKVQIAYLKKVLIKNIILAFIICAIFFLIILNPYFTYFKDKYNIQIDIIAPLVIFGIFQITTTVDWYLQANNKENMVTIAAVWQLLIFMLISLFVVLAGASFVWILWGHALARGVHLLIQLCSLVQAPAEHDDRSSDL